MARRDEVMPLEEFTAEKQQEIADAVAQPRPPEKWLNFGLFQIHSRAWYEWHWQRGIDPDKSRPAIPLNVREAVKKRDAGICQICFDPVDPTDIHLDHIKPYSQGGPDTVSNLRVTHSLCNIKRGAPVEDSQHPSGVLVE